jgi:fermentation-respiration switch protein FrsA (DUF1100 family)
MNTLYTLAQGASDLVSSLLTSTVATTTASTSPESTIKQVVPLNKYPWPLAYEPSREEVLQALNGNTISIETADNVKLDAVWALSEKENGPTALLFHGNGCTLNAMADHAKWYHDRGINTLLLTIRGYPGSEGDVVKDGELGLYLDVEAAMRYITETKGVSNEMVVAHGYSLGGSLAAAAGLFFGTNVTLDHTFTSLAGVGKHIAERMLEDSCSTLSSSYTPSIPEFLPKGVVEGSFPSGLKRQVGEKTLITDGLNTIEKAKQFDKELFVIYGENDALMPPAFSDELYEAKYGPVPSEANVEERKGYLQHRTNHIAMIPGGHWGLFSQHSSVSEKYAQHLYNIGLMDKKYLT